MRPASLLRPSVAAAVATIALKTLARPSTGSVGLLSDALESVVNLVAALLALVPLHWSSLRPGEQHASGARRRSPSPRGSRAG